MQFVRIAEAAEILDVSEGLLRKLIALGKIPFYKLSEKTTRIDIDELRNCMRVLPETISDPSDESWQK